MTNFLLKKAGLAFDEGKTRAALKTSTLALLMVIETKTSSAKAKRKKAAAGLQSGMSHQASMDVEQLIRQDFEIQAYDAIKVQCNQLADRLRVLGSEKECPPGTKQAVCTLIWAAGKAEVPAEIQVVKLQLTKKYGKEFATKALNNDDSCVNKLVAEKLLFQADPAPQLVEEYLEAIEKESDMASTEEKAPAPPTRAPLVARLPVARVPVARAPAAPAAAAAAAAKAKAKAAPAAKAVPAAKAAPAAKAVSAENVANTASARTKRPAVVIATEPAPEESPTKNASKPLTKASIDSPRRKPHSKTPGGGSRGKHAKEETSNETPEVETPQRTRSRESPEDETPKTAPTTTPSSSTSSPTTAQQTPPPQFMKSVAAATAKHDASALESEPPVTPESSETLPVSIRRAGNAAAGAVRPIIPA